MEKEHENLVTTLTFLEVEAQIAGGITAISDRLATVYGNLEALTIEGGREQMIAEFTELMRSEIEEIEKRLNKTLAMK